MLRETEYFMLRNIDRKYINPLFLDGRERLLKHRSGQCLFLPHAEFETKGVGFFVFITLMYMLKKIYMSEKNNHEHLFFSLLSVTISFY